MTERAGLLHRAPQPALRYRLLAGRQPTIVFLPGFRSDFGGDKASALAIRAAATGRALLRFDYSGHGGSEGNFADGTLGQWAADAGAAIAALCPDGRLVLVGSSMGGWIALLLARGALGARLAGLVGIAAAPDFTEALMWPAMDAAARAALVRDGSVMAPDAQGAPYPITRALIEDGRAHLLLAGDQPILCPCPVRLLHGQHDTDVPWATALRIAARVTATDVRVTLVKDGDHRLSRPSDLALLHSTLAELLGEDGR